MPRFLFRFGHLSVDLCNTCSNDTHNTWMWVGECAIAGETALVFIQWMHSTWDTSLSSSSCSNTAVDLVDHGLRARNFACFVRSAFGGFCWLEMAIIIPSEGNFVVSIWIVHDSRQRTWHSINFDKTQRDLRSHLFNGRALCKSIPVQTQQPPFQSLILLSCPHCP